MNITSLSNQLLFNTVRLTATDESGNANISTGFLVTATEAKGAIPFLVTCAHSVGKAKFVELACVRAGAGDTPQLGSIESVRISTGDLLSFARQDSNLDVCVIPFAPILNHFETSGKRLFVRPLSLDNFIKSNQRAELNAIEDLVFVGYPKGLYDHVNLLPLIRKGISATPIWADFQGKPWFLIDAEVFAGSSGSPVFILNEGAYPTGAGLNIGTRFHFVGMIIKSLDETTTGQHIGLGTVLAAAPIEAYIGTAVRELAAKAV